MRELTVEDCASERGLGRLTREIYKQMLVAGPSRIGLEDLSFAQWLALSSINAAPMCKAGDVAQDIKMNTGATSRLIDGLVKRGFVSSNRLSDDRRALSLSVTPAGSAKILEMAPMQIAFWTDALAGFDEEEFQQLTDLLAKLLDGLKRLSTLPRGDALEASRHVCL